MSQDWDPEEMQREVKGQHLASPARDADGKGQRSLGTVGRRFRESGQEENQEGENLAIDLDLHSKIILISLNC